MAKKIISILLVLVLIGGISYALYENKKVLDEAKQPKELNLDVSVNVYTVTYGSVSESISKVGTLQPIEEITVVSEGNGRVTSLLFQEGSYVKAGQVIAKLDSDMQRAQLIAAEAAYEKAETDYERLSGLLDKGSVTKAQVEQALLGYKNAESQFLIAKKQLANTTITAGISGTVSKKHTNKGAFLAMGSPVADIVNTSNLELEVKLSEQDISKIKTGQKISIYSDIYPSDRFSGTVKFIAPKADKDRMYPVKIALRNLPGKDLKAGMFATVSFDWNSGNELLMIPSRAVTGPADSPFVFVEQNGKAIKKEITTGPISDNMTGIIAGISPGEKVITTNITNLENGTPVNVLQDTNKDIPLENISSTDVETSENQ